jgi:hypothetical protein
MAHPPATSGCYAWGKYEHAYGMMEFHLGHTAAVPPTIELI